MLFGDCRTFHFQSLAKSTTLVSKGLLCSYDKQNMTRLLVDMKFLFSWSTRHLTSSLTLEEKFNTYARPCIILYITSSHNPGGRLSHISPITHKRDQDSSISKQYYSVS